MRNELRESIFMLKRRNWAGLLYLPTENSLLQLFRYCFVGGSAFLVDFGSYVLLEAIGIHYLIAGVFSFVFGFALNFLLSRKLIFWEASGTKVAVGELISVLGISAVGLLLTEVFLFAGTDLLMLDVRFSKIIASLIVLFWNYFARKKFVYMWLKLWRKYRGLFFYLVFGLLTTVVNIGTYHLCYEVWNVPNVPSNILAWTLAVAIAYITNKLWVFNSKSFAPDVFFPELWKFVSCRLGTGFLELAIMWVGVDLLYGPGTPLKIGSSFLVVILNYVFSKLIIFRKEKNAP